MKTCNSGFSGSEVTIPRTCITYQETRVRFQNSSRFVTSHAINDWIPLGSNHKTKDQRLIRNRCTYFGQSSPMSMSPNCSSHHLSSDRYPRTSPYDTMNTPRQGKHDMDGVSESPSSRASCIESTLATWTRNPRPRLSCPNH